MAWVFFPPLISKVILKCNSQIHFILFNLLPFLLNQLGIMYLKLRKSEGDLKRAGVSKEN